MICRLTYWAVFGWVLLGTLLMVFTSVMALRDPKLHFGLGIIELMGARALIASLPLAICGLAGLWLMLRHQASGPCLVGVFCLTLTVSLGLDVLRDFNNGVAIIAGLCLLATAWSVWAVWHRQPGRQGRARAASAGTEHPA